METPVTSEPAKCQRNPWYWVPSLYFAQGVPYVIVMTMSVIMYKRLGISLADIAFYTSWLYLPWVIKPLWSPLVDITRTKRFWTVSMQFFIAGGLALVAAAVPMNRFFFWSIALFWVMAFASATHDIAADGFYMLSMSKHEQAWWVGLRSTFYRTAMIMGSGLLVVLAGVLESRNGLPPAEVSVQATHHYKKADEERGLESMKIPIPAAASGSIQIVTFGSGVGIPLLPFPTDQTKAIITQIRAWNRQQGFVVEEQPAKKTDESKGWWTTSVSEPFGDWLKKLFPKETKGAVPATAGNVGPIYLSLSKAPDAGKTIAVNLERKKSGLEYIGLAKGDKGFRLIEGERFVFNSTNWNKPAAALIQLDPKLKDDATVAFVATSGNIPAAWSITLFVVAGLFFCFAIWHSFILPRPVNDGPVISGKSLLGDFFATLGSFFRKPGVGQGLAFILLYRFDEAQLSKVINPFLLDARELGGLALTTSQVGLAYGTFGIAALTCGGLFGAFMAAKHGLKKMFPYMIASMYLPKLTFVFLSILQPDNFLVACAAVSVEQLGYGFGFTAFMLYMLAFSDGPHKTAHYAMCTGFMALGMMLPGMWSGWLADLIGYKHFFIWIIFSAIPGFIIALTLKVDANFGKRVEPAKA